MPIKSENISSAPIQLSEGGESVDLTTADIQAIDQDKPAVEVNLTHRHAVPSEVDDMNAADEVFDRSKFIEYFYFKCVSPKPDGTPCGRKIFAGAYDAGPIADEAQTAKGEVECTCVPDPTQKKPYKGRNNEELFVHGVMRLHHYKQPRPVKA